MSVIRRRSPRRLSAATLALLFSAAAFVAPAIAADSVARLPDLAGQWGRDMLFFEPPPSGPGPIVNSMRKADGTIVARDLCCPIFFQGGNLGDPANPIL